MYSVSDFISLVAPFFLMCLIKLQKDATLPFSFDASIKWVLSLLRVHVLFQVIMVSLVADACKL